MSGDDLEPQLQAALRDRPPREVLEWVRAVTGASRVVDVRALPGGTSSAVHRVTLEPSSGRPVDVVLRRYVLDWVAEEPYVPANEATVLTLLEPTPVPAPRLIASDPGGSVTGTPAILMSHLPGAVVWATADRERWLRAMAELLVTVHAVPVVSELREWFAYAPAPGLVPPPWTRHPLAWERALAAYAGAAPPSRRAFLHRDYHPGNVLWSRRRAVSGLVDWAEACGGPPEVDVAHCRFNLAVHAGDAAAADRFLELWQSMAGSDSYDPRWDLITAVSVADEEPDPALDAFVASAVARQL